MLEKNENQKRTKKRLSFRQRNVLMFISTVFIAMFLIPVVGTIRSQNSISEVFRSIPFWLQMIPYFPLGLGGLVGFSSSSVLPVLIVSWLIYIAIGIAMACVKSHRSARLAMIVLAVLLLINICGCEAMLYGIVG